MPGCYCAVVSCNNSRLTVRGEGNNIQFHSFPKEPTVKEEWIKFCQKPGEWSINSSRICSAHFKDEDYEKNLQYKLLGLRRRAILKKHTVPSLNPPDSIDSNTFCRSKNLGKMRKQLKKPKVLKTSSFNDVDIEPKQSYKDTEQPFIEEKEQNKTTNKLSEFPAKFSSVCASKIERDNPKIEIEIIEDTRNCNETIEIKRNNGGNYNPVDAKSTVNDLNFQSVTADSVKTTSPPQNQFLDVNSIVNNNFSVRLVPVDSLEAKYNNLCKENQFLKEQLAKIGQCSISTPYVLEDGEKRTEANNVVIDLTDIHSVCRTCLQKTTDLVSIYDVIVFEYKDFPELSIVEALESIMSDPVEVTDNIPSHICTQCKNQLKLFHTFKYIYKKATSILKLYVNGAFRGTNKNSVPVDHNYFKEDFSSVEENVDIKPQVFDDVAESDSDADTVAEDIPERCEDLIVPELIKISRPLQKKSVKKNTETTNTCPICWIQLPFSEFIAHVKSHKTLDTYLKGPTVSRRTRFYASPRSGKGLMCEQNGKVYNCPVCRADFKAAEYIMHLEHHWTHDSFSCETCNRTFKKKSYLLLHMLVHSKDFPFRCETCNKGFVVKSNYDCHLLTHKDEELPIKCYQCDKRFSNPKHFSRHMTVHTENRNYSTKYKYKWCKYCSHSFMNKEELIKHVCQKFGIYSCKYCGKGFSTPKNRYIHIRTVHFKGRKLMANKNSHSKGYSKALCSVCGFYASNIYQHMETHRDVKQVLKRYKCPICSKQFAYSTILKKHLLVHSGLKPYICTYCAKAFNCSYNLKVHERIHIGNRCHVCRVCKKGFLEKSYLNKHMKVHKNFSSNNQEEDSSLVISELMEQRYEDAS